MNSAQYIVQAERFLWRVGKIFPSGDTAYQAVLAYAVTVARWATLGETADAEARMMEEFAMNAADAATTPARRAAYDYAALLYHRARNS